MVTLIIEGCCACVKTSERNPCGGHKCAYFSLGVVHFCILLFAFFYNMQIVNYVIINYYVKYSKYNKSRARIYDT